MPENNSREVQGSSTRRTRSIKVRGDLLRSQRLKCVWTQSDMARASGLSERLIRLAENDGPIEVNSVNALASALGIPSEAIGVNESDRAVDATAVSDARRFLEQIWNFGNMDVIEELLLPEFRFHHERGVVSNREEMRQRIQTFRESFSDFDFVVEDAIDYGSFIVCRWRVAMTHSGSWLSLPPTNRRATVFGSSWVQVVDGKFGDAWDYWDPESLYRELAS